MLDLEPIKAREAAAMRGDRMAYTEGPVSLGWRVAYTRDIPTLIAEVERLRGETDCCHIHSSEIPDPAWGRGEDN
jgi:hypothetical protein